MQAPPVLPLPPFQCPRCHAMHDGGEPGFGLPDAAFALTLSPEEREVYAEFDNEDVVTVRDGAYVRAVAYFPILGSSLRFGIGFWVQVSSAAFAHFEAREHGSHPTYDGRIANQSMYFTPTLGLSVRIDFAGVNMRPSISFVDPSHPLSQAQHTGLDGRLVDAWRAICKHEGEPTPVDEPWQPDLTRHGFEIVSPELAGRPPATPARAPIAHDKVKVAIAFLAADETGTPTRLNAGWWIELDDLRRPSVWGGTLANQPRVPATIHLGSRIWIEPRHVLEYAY